MADKDFQADIGALSGRAPPAPGAGAFAHAVERWIARMQWLRMALVSVFVAIGLLIAWRQLGLNPGDLTGVHPLRHLNIALQWDNTGLWAAAMLLIGVLWLLTQPLSQEN